MLIKWIKDYFTKENATKVLELGSWSSWIERLWMSLAQTRLDITHNRVVTENYAQMLQDADDYIQGNLLDIDEVEKRKILVCDHTRISRPKYRDWTDEEILDRFEKLNGKYERGEGLV